MTKVTYAIKMDGIVVKTVDTYKEAVSAVEAHEDCTYEAVYSEYDPKDTPERRARFAEQVAKAEVYRAQKALAPTI